MAIAKPRAAITFAERCAIERLARCTFPVGSAHKQFARQMNEALRVQPALPPAITDGQRDRLWRLVYRYRRQILKQEHLRDAQLAIAHLTQPLELSIFPLPHNQTHIKELVSIAAQIMNRIGLRRRVAALRAEAQKQA